MKWIKEILNIQYDENQKWILLISFTVCLMIGWVSPVLSKTLMTALPAKWFAANTLLVAGSTMAVNSFWKGSARKWIIKHFPLIAAIESLVGIAVISFMLIRGFNPWFWVWMDLFTATLIGTFIKNGIKSIKSVLWNEKAREQYEINAQQVQASTVMIGSALALIQDPTITQCEWVMLICYIINYLGWIKVYFNNRNKIVDYSDED